MLMKGLEKRSGRQAGRQEACRSENNFRTRCHHVYAQRRGRAGRRERNVLGTNGESGSTQCRQVEEGDALGSAAVMGKPGTQVLYLSEAQQKAGAGPRECPAQTTRTPRLAQVPQAPLSIFPREPFSQNRQLLAADWLRD